MMPVTAIGQYDFPPNDRVENFNGNLMIHLLWDEHLMFVAPISVPVPPDTPFEGLVGAVLPQLYGRHPDFEKIVWQDVEWTLDGASFSPAPDQTLAGQGIAHKSLLRFKTPGLDGLFGAKF
jgi:phenol/toluene 2-monooxygenase (NADH) P4/A4